jgi:hypothetical protein
MIEITVCNRGTENKAGGDVREQEPTTSFTQCDTEHRKKGRNCGVQRRRLIHFNDPNIRSNTIAGLGGNVPICAQYFILVLYAAEPTLTNSSSA